MVGPPDLGIFPRHQVPHSGSSPDGHQENAAGPGQARSPGKVGSSCVACLFVERCYVAILPAIQGMARNEIAIQIADGVSQYPVHWLWRSVMVPRELYSVIGALTLLRPFINDRMLEKSEDTTRGEGSRRAKTEHLESYYRTNALHLLLAFWSNSTDEFIGHVTPYWPRAPRWKRIAALYPRRLPLLTGISPCVFYRFIEDRDIVEQIRQTFVGLYSLEPVLPLHLLLFSPLTFSDDYGVRSSVPLIISALLSFEKGTRRR